MQVYTNDEAYTVDMGNIPSAKYDTGKLTAEHVLHHLNGSDTRHGHRQGWHNALEEQRGQIHANTKATWPPPCFSSRPKEAEKIQA